MVIVLKSFSIRLSFKTQLRLYDVISIENVISENLVHHQQNDII